MVQVNGYFTKAVPYVNNRVSQRRLARKSGRKGYHIQTIGLTESGLTLKVLSSFSVQTSNQSDQACVTMNAIQLEYGFGRTPVLIDRRYRPGSCEYAAIYNHEIEHIRIMNTKGQSYFYWLKQQVALQTRSIKPTLTKRPKGTQRWMAGQVKKIASGLIKQMNHNLSLAHAAIDTPANYKRTQAQCSGW